ncbi:dTDP-4-dehydrorhamnose reductase [Oceaniserpentilla sp. 4NH20-0058]|uniref:dTDP-4-dehydrorhamnose reductase n=1 Tax=Oceaniserpentilla sp. 4NH20-0058 TaxID=3127660 RepID=UPI00310640A7
MNNKLIARRSPTGAQMKVLITGKNGQLGYELQQTVPVGAEVYAYASSELDISDEQAVQEIMQTIKPNIVINAAAYTAVDNAESNEEAAYAVNAKGAEYLALACKENNARLIHVSTDFVFDATKNTPYESNDKTNPLGVYGASKLAGCKAINDHHAENSVIIRTSWVYSSHGNNFVKTMLRLMAERPELGVVSDQIGSPTWAKGLAVACWGFAQNKVNGIYHYSDLGVASWYDFAVAIQNLALANNLLENQIEIKPIKAAAYPTPAKRPAYSVMNTDSTYEILNLQGKHWQAALNEMLIELKKTDA